MSEREQKRARGLGLSIIPGREWPRSSLPPSGRHTRSNKSREETHMRAPLSPPPLHRPITLSWQPRNLPKKLLTYFTSSPKIRTNICGAQFLNYASSFSAHSPPRNSISALWTISSAKPSKHPSDYRTSSKSQLFQPLHPSIYMVFLPPPPPSPLIHPQCNLPTGFFPKDKSVTESTLSTRRGGPGQLVGGEDFQTEE